MAGAHYLKNLALSETGFLFDPSTGNTFVLNETAAFLLRMMKQDGSEEKIMGALLDEYDVTEEQARRDLADLFLQLKEFGLVND